MEQTATACLSAGPQMPACIVLMTIFFLFLELDQTQATSLKAGIQLVLKS